MGGRIDAFIDCASPYSYIAFAYLRKQRELLAQYDIEIEFHPVFLGGINHASGNQSPAFNKSKAALSSYDLRRASTFYHLPPLTPPPFFPMNSLLPQRAICAVKSLYPRHVFESVYDSFWPAVYTRHVDLAQPANLLELLAGQLGAGEAEKVVGMAAQAEWKARLNENTKRAIDAGAFGAPWFIIRDDGGREEPVFGSDRWAYIFRYLGVEIEEMRIVERKALEGGKARM